MALRAGLNSLLLRNRAHLQSAGESYLQHLHFAFAFGAALIVAGLSCLVHAVLPGLFTDRASKAVGRLQDILKHRHESRHAPPIGTEGMLTLIALSFIAMLIPWFTQAHPAISSSLTLLALGVPAAALRGPEEGSVEDHHSGGPRLAVPTPRGLPPRHVVIIGGGFSGTALAHRLAGPAGPRITIVERRPEPGRGLAYATESPNHLLNVRAAKMSARTDAPAHFTTWLRRRGLGGPYDFVPRRTYAAYLDELLAEVQIASGGRLRIVTGEAVDVELAPSRPTVRLADGRSLVADNVVLAGVNLPPRDPPILADAQLPPGRYLASPWESDPAVGLDDSDTVLIIGTGLTMADTIVSLTDAGFSGKIIAASRHGLCPRAHAYGPEGGNAPPYQAGTRLTALLQQVRNRADAIGWRAAVDELRPVTQALWSGASEAQRASFLRHLRPYWEVHRHRLPPAVADRIEGLRATGRLRIMAATPNRVVPGADGVAVRLRLRGLAYAETFNVARIINCTGPNADIETADDPLLRSLLRKGMIRPDRHGLGLEVNSHGATVDLAGNAQPALFAMGPLTRGTVWEMTAVPELRAQAAALARTMAARADVRS